jgi:hypothetical protein
MIDKWMDIHNVKIMIIPSFTELYSPFRNKLAELVSFNKNKEKYFIFANVAKYGGSGIYNYKFRRDYEYGRIKLLDANEESWKLWKISQ